MSVNSILTSRKLASFKLRFDARVKKIPETGCWEWQGTLIPAGYGQIRLDSELHRTHRVAWVLANGPIPESGVIRPFSVCHKCDNRRCVNPDHLFLGTDRDNALDATRKGRMAQGEKHYRAKLTAAQVLAIRQDTRSDRLVAEDYGVSKGTVASLRRPGSWPSLGMVEIVPDRHATNVNKGEDVALAKLTEAQVLEIRADPRPLKVLAQVHGVSKGAILSVKQRKTWAHIPPHTTDVPSQRQPAATGDARKRKTTRAVREAILASSASSAALAERFSISVATVYKIRNDSGSGKGLAMLRRAVEAVIANREEMDDGWFVPTDVMSALEEMLGKRRRK